MNNQNPMETSRRSLSVFLFFAIVSLLMVSCLIVRCHGEELGRAAVLPPPQTNNNITIPPTASVKRDPQVSITEVLMKEQRNKDYNNVQDRKRNRKNGGGGGGWRWGNGRGGGGGGGSSSSGSIGGGGGWGWGGGGGGGGWWGWGCMSPKRNHHNNGGGDKQKKRRFNNGDYRIGEFAECMGRGRCQGMRLDCPLHCGGPCFYDCKNMCKAHCRSRN